MPLHWIEIYVIILWKLNRRTKKKKKMQNTNYFNNLSYGHIKQIFIEKI